MEGFLVVIAIIAMLAGAIFYNPLRRKVDGIIGVGGAYIILIGVLLLVMTIGNLFGLSSGETQVSDLIVAIVFLLLSIAYTVYVMICKCETVIQRVTLPFVATLIGMGFCWRLLLKLFLHVPMAGGGSSGGSGSAIPQYIYSPQGDTYRLTSSDSIHANYECSKTGNKVQFTLNASDKLALPAGWRT